jgi:trk system potassium uptake protein TrkA
MVVGDPLEREVLQRAGLDGADAVAVVNDSDDLNLALALAVRRLFRVPRVVARLHAPDRAALYHRLGVLTLSPIAGGVRRLLDQLTLSPLHPLASLGQVDLVEIHVPPTLVGHPLGALEVPGEVRLVALTRDGATHLASPETPVAAGDVVHLAVREPALGRLRALLGLE